MSNALMRRLVSLLILTALVFSGFLASASAARADDSALAEVASAPISTSVTHSGDSLTSTSTMTEEQRTQLALSKMDPSLKSIALEPNKGYTEVVVHTSDMPALGSLLESVGARRSFMIDERAHTVRFSARPWGAVDRTTSIQIQVPNEALLQVASLDGVEWVAIRETGSTLVVDNEVTSEEREGFLRAREEIRNNEFREPPALASSGGDSVSPTSWAIAREHRALDVWRDLGYDGSGVYVAVFDTGEDFGHPSLQGQWAVDTNPASPYFGSPIMFHPASMEALMGAGFWTAGSDWDRLPIPYWLSVNDGDTWYSNTDYRANDTDLDGDIVYAHGSPDPVTGMTQYTPRYNPQQYGNFGGNAQSRVNRNYWIGAPGDPDQIISASGLYRLGLARDDSLTGLWGEKVGLLLVDSTTPEVYDTIYVDLNFNLDFTDDKAVTQADPIAVADLTGDGIADVSGGLLYYIASSSSVAGELVINNIVGTETSASLANADIATDIDGWFTFQPPTRMWLAPPVGAPLYFPGTTETLYEVFTTSGDETNTQYQLGGASTLFGTVNIITFQDVPAGQLLRGPDTDFGVDFIYDILDDASFASLGLVEDTDYTFDASTGTITWLTDIPDVDVAFLYQLATYSLDPIAGTLAFLDSLPTGYDLLADYDTGLPLPYGNEYASLHGYDAFIPGNGDLVAFHGEFDYGQSHGSFVSSTIAARPFGNLASPLFDVFGTAPGAKIIGLAACCNAAGPIGLFAEPTDIWDFAALGYDGLPNTGDEAQIVSNSWGYTTIVNTGFSFTDRWLWDYSQRYPTVTQLIAFGNNGAGYATGAPGGTSPGVVTVGAGTSGDYRVLYAFDGGEGFYEFPLCPGPPPIDPATCVGIGAGSGDGPGPYGEHAYFSSRGPTLLGQPKPDVVSIGSFAVEAGPLNVYCFEDPGFCDGNFAFDIFSGTSQATPVTSGIAALAVEAYRSAHLGANPTNSQVKGALKSGADDMHRDVLQQGAGWTNAYRTAQIMAELDGISASPDFWVPGGYGGVSRPAFVNLLAAGATSQATITVTNHHPTLAKNILISAAVYTRMGPGVFSWPTSLGTGSGRHYILKPDGVYAIDGSTLLSAQAWTTQWNSADFMKVTWTYDSAAYTGFTSWRMDIFDWYDYAHAVGLTQGSYDGGGWEEFVAEADVTAYTNTLLLTGQFGETKGVLFDPAVQGWVANPYSFARSIAGPLTEVPACVLADPTLYSLDTAGGTITLCAPLADGEDLTGTYSVYDLVSAGDSVFLLSTGVVAGSETVYLNGAVWPAANYAITYATGEFVFRTDLSPADVVEIDYMWDHPGIYDGFSERNRATVAVFGSSANSVHESFGLLPTKIHDGLVLNPRSGASAAIPSTLVVEFYETTPWGWVTTSVPSLNVPGTGASRPFTVTASVPAGSAPGLYEGAVYLQDGGMTTTIPVVINVPVTGFPVTLGGNLPTTSLYDNNGVIQGARSGWRQIGDSRYVWADLNVASAAGRRMIYNAILQGRLSDPEMFVYNCIADPDGFTADATYGPCRMNLLSKTKEFVGSTDTLFPNRDFMHSDAVRGLIAFQIKSFGSTAAVATGGSEPLTASIGIMQATLNGPGNPLGATEVATATNRLTGSVPLTVWANVPMYGGLGSAVTATSTNRFWQMDLQFQTDPNAYGDFNEWLCTMRPPNIMAWSVAANTISITFHITSNITGDDHDLGVFFDVNNNGVCDYGVDTFMGRDADGDSDETVTLGFPAVGQYLVQAGWFTSLSNRWNLEIIRSFIGTSAYSLVNAPTTDVPASTTVNTGVGWAFPPTQPQGVVVGQLFISPGYAPFALALGLTMRVRYDTTAVTIQDFSPLPGSTTRDAGAPVVANVFDTAVQMINVDSARLWVDGVDVTQLSRKLPVFASAVSCCYNLLTMVYDPATRWADGPHSAAIEVQDLAGNVARATWSWTVDSHPPVISLTSPAGDLTTSTAALTVSGTAPGAVEVTVNGNLVTVDSVTGAFSTTVTLVAGANTIDVFAMDAAGNSATESVTVTLDTAAPALIGVRSSEPSRTRADTTEISGSVGEEVQSVTVNGAPVLVMADGSFSTRLTLSEGTNGFTVRATDLAGNVATATVNVVRDTVAPSIGMTPIANRYRTNVNDNTATIAGSVTGSDTSLVTINGIAVASGAGTFTRDFPLSIGANVFVVEATDDLGNRATVTETVTYAPIVQNVTRSYTSVILMGVAAVLLVVGFLVGWMITRGGGGGGGGGAPAMMPPAAPRASERMAPEPEEMPAEEEMTTEEEEL